MKVFSVSGYWNDDGEPFSGQIVTERNGIPEGYEDEDILYYGILEEDLMGSNPNTDFTITSYVVIEEN